MKKIYFILILLLLLISIGCSNEKISNNVKIHKEYNVFHGEGQNWEAQIIADFTETFTNIDGKWNYNSKEKEGSKGYLRYKGSDTDSIKNISYEVTSGGDKQGGSREKYPESREIILGTGLYRSDDILSVTVKWNGKEETFKMKSVEGTITDEKP